ncbi:hypothetical protein [Streptomyces candidus]|uniref:Uncharacterized protein n=1 Tax=Streptomyces candidus TaxID=67283 RepID=A0A7X0HCE1_9ACTN|nr:hypothetical protein [Streptomyces candidus]MBB6435051.1 hypothetical protein [Streptomyces candidus]
MGFWGYFVVGKNTGPLSGLEALSEVREDLALYDERVGGWQVWERPSELEVGDMGALARGVCRETGAPALFAFVMGSDCVVVEAAMPDGGSWFACLGREAMAGYLQADGLLLEDLFLSPQDAAEKGVAWAAEAGKTVELEPLVTVLSAEADPLAEELFGYFLDVLGLERQQ